MHEGIEGSTMITFGGGHLFFIRRVTEVMDVSLQKLRGRYTGPMSRCTVE